VIYPRDAIEAATAIPWWTRLRLLFVRRRRAFDGDSWVDYKVLGHHVYVVDAKP